MQRVIPHDSFWNNYLWCRWAGGRIFCGRVWAGALQPVIVMHDIAVFLLGGCAFMAATGIALLLNRGGRKNDPFG